MERSYFKDKTKTVCPRFSSMMSNVAKLYNLTKELYDLLNQPITSNNREDVIQQINELVEERGNYINELTPPYSEQDKKMGQTIVRLNKQIQHQMQTLFNDLKVEMKQVKKQKRSKRSYTNPYEQVRSVDGMFLDQKK